MNVFLRTLCLFVVAVTAQLDGVSQAFAQDEVAKDPATPKKELPLDVGQQAVLSRFDRFEKELVQMAEQLRKADPERAELLFRTHSKSQQERVIGQMRMIHELLGGKPPQFGDSIERQEELVASLLVLLDLLQSENRISEIEAERARVNAILKNVNKLIGKEKDVRAKTERGADTDESAKDQEGVSKDAENLIETIKQQDAQKQADQEARGGKPAGSNPEDGEGAPGDKEPDKAADKDDKPKDPSKPADGSSKPKEPGDKDPKEGEPKGGSPSEGDPKPGDSPSSKPQEGQPQEGQPQEGQPQSGKPQSGKPQEGQPQEGQPSDQQKTPGREDLEEARQEMEKAIEELRKQKDRGKASRHQDEAIRQLLEAKEKLEEILRQLREEEKSLTLASLESRFRKMLSMQLLVYQETIRLDKEFQGSENDANRIARARQMATQQEEIVQEVDKALVVLREEGSSVAFPEAVEAIREDAASIVQLLDQAKAGELTQTLEQGVIEAIEEMIDALQKEMEKKGDEEPQEGKPQEGQPQDQPLVDALSELKMLRSLQLRINRRTRQLGRMIEGDQADEPEVLKQLKTLSGRQSSVQKATYDLSTGRNK
ncbi:MAG: hypothetical protein O3B86_07235 [Planctomycetota bacterium]|nr:hypothetical protein [Planctomycetota bacterium]